MKQLPKITTLVPVTLLSALLATGAPAAQAAAGVTPGYPTQTEMLKTADAALHALTRVHAARIALFDNDIATARSQLDEAQTAFLGAEKAFNDLTIADTEVPDTAARYLPFDMSMALDEDFTLTDDSKQALSEAKDLMRQGSTDRAVDVLRLAAVDVDVTTALLPVVATTDHLEQAVSALDAGRYFDANLALKSIEESIILRHFAIDAIPVQGADPGAAQGAAETATQTATQGTNG